MQAWESHLGTPRGPPVGNEGIGCDHHFLQSVSLNNRIIFIKQYSISIYKTGNSILFWLVSNACVHKELLEPLFLQILAAASPHSLTHIHIFKLLLRDTKESLGSMNIV